MTKSTSNIKGFIGVDLGTTNTGGSTMDNHGTPKMIPNENGNIMTPSVVSVNEDATDFQVGESAEHTKILDPDQYLAKFKRDVGTNTVYRKAGNEDITPMRLQAETLKAFRKVAIQYLGDPHAAKQAVIAVPAYFGEVERQSVMESAKLAGFQVLSLINEPTAAALAYGFHNKQGDRLLIVLDLGGGTFDCSVVSMNNSESRVEASHGDQRLGGEDVNDAIMAMVIEAFKKEHSIQISRESHPQDWFTIEEEVERKKKLLSARTEVTIGLRVDGKNISLTLTREGLNKLIQPILDRCEAIIKETIKRAKIDVDEISNVLMVGGSTRLKPFEALVKRLFDEEKIHRGQTSPDTAVAEGALLEAARIISEQGKQLIDDSHKAIPAPSLKRIDTMSHSLGVTVADPISKATVCSVILERDSAIPATEVEQYGAVDASQDQFLIQVIQGEDGQRLEDCLVVGESLLTLPPRDPMKKSISVSMGYDKSGLVTVNVTDEITGKTSDITVDFYAKTKTTK